MTFQQWYEAANWLHLNTTQTALIGGFAFFVAILIAYAIAAIIQRTHK